MYAERDECTVHVVKMQTNLINKYQYVSQTIAYTGPIYDLILIDNKNLRVFHGVQGISSTCTLLES